MLKLQNFRDFFEMDVMFRSFGISFVDDMLHKWGWIFGHISYLELCALIFQLIVGIYKNLRSSGEFITVVEQICLMRISFQTLLSGYLIFYRKRNVMIGIIRTLKDMYPKTASHDQSRNIRQKYQILNFFVDFSYVSRIFCIIMYGVKPFLVYFYEAYMLRSVELQLPYDVYIPFDISNMNVYSIIYALLVWASITLVFQLTSCDLIYCSILSVVSIQFDVIAEKVRNVHPRNSNAKDTLKDFVENQIVLMNLIKDLNGLYNWILVYNFLTSSIFLCSLTFLVLHGLEPSQCAIFGMILSASLIQIFLFCFYSEEMLKSNANLADSLYENLWYEGDKEYKEMILVMMIQSQRPKMINAYNFCDVNFETFTKMLNGAYSYFSVLKSLY